MVVCRDDTPLYWATSVPAKRSNVGGTHAALTPAIMHLRSFQQAPAPLENTPGTGILPHFSALPSLFRRAIRQRWRHCHRCLGFVAQDLARTFATTYFISSHGGSFA